MKDKPRSTFQAMIKITEKREFDIWVVDALSRFSRNAKDALSVVETFKEYGVGIRQRLNTYVGVDGIKVCEEMIDTFVERIIYSGNDEFLWIINLSGSAVDSEGKYRIPKYDKGYSDHLKSDKDFDVVAQFIIPLEECKKYCEGGLHRRFVKKYWKPIIIKIAVC